MIGDTTGHIASTMINPEAIMAEVERGNCEYNARTCSERTRAERAWAAPEGNACTLWWSVAAFIDMPDSH
jgi:hypothetical protein